MEEDRNRQTAEDNRKTLGLSLSDTDYYCLNGQEPAASYREEMHDTKDGKGRSAVLPFLLGVLACAAMICAATELFGLGRFVTKKQYDYYRDLDDSYGKYYEIMKLINEDPLAENEVKDISDDELKEIVAATGDPYAEYFTAEEYEEFEKKYAGEYIGIGIGVEQDGKEIIVRSVFEDSPAEKAGMQSGDVLAKIDGKVPEDVDDAIDLLSGDAGTPVTVTVRRGDENIELKMNRAKIDQDSVEYRKLEEAPDVGYIRISSFIKDTDKDFRMAVRELRDEGCTSFIIDLRDNGGGLTDSSIEIADYLLPACRIMSETTKSGAETVYTSKPSSAEINYVVLVNGNTASASEILTAAIQDNKGGTVIGEKTYGKGVTQTTHRFRDGSAIKITVTEYFRPNGEAVNDVGITPDIKADDDEAMDKALEELKQ